MCVFKKLLITLSACIFIASCSTKPVMIGKDTYLMASGTYWGASSGRELKVELLHDAEAYCREKGMHLLLVDSKDSGGRDYYGSKSSAEIQFRCLREDDPEFKRPALKQPDVTIEMK